MPVTWLLLLNKSDVADLDYVRNLASYCTDREMGGGEKTLFTIVVEETRGLFTFRPRKGERGGGGGREREKETDRQTDRQIYRHTERVFSTRLFYSKFNFFFSLHMFHVIAAHKPSSFTSGSAF